MPVLHDDGRAELTLTASPGSYVAFCGVWVCLAHPGDRAETAVVVLLLLVSCASALWLRGHRVRVQSGLLEYRDGLFREHHIRVDEIESLGHTSQPLAMLGREIRLPRTMVTGRGGSLSFEMNLKPFSRSGIAALHRSLPERLRGSAQL